jgi:hypothetical protein
MIPDLKQLGYNIMAAIFFGTQETENEGMRRDLLKGVRKMEEETRIANLIVVNGIGLKKGRMIINLYKNYSDFTESLKTIKNLPYVDASEVESFLVDLNDKRNFRTLSLEQLSRNIQPSGKN